MVDFASLATNFGVAVACLVALGLAVYKALKFVGENILQPVALRTVKFMDDLSVAVTNQSQSLQFMAASQKDAAALQEEEARQLGLIMDMLMKMFAQQDALLAKMTRMYERYGERQSDKAVPNDLGSG